MDRETFTNTIRAFKHRAPFRPFTVAMVYGDRPNRYEPRARKRRPKKYPPLTEPRDKARARLAAAG